MPISFNDATKRILICGASDVEYVLPKFDVGLVFITKPSVEDIDYAGVPTYTPYIKGYTPQTGNTLHDFKRATDFLNEKPDEYLLVHCNAGIGVSASFALALLIHIQGDSHAPDAAVRAVRKMTNNPLFSITQYHPHLPITEQTAIDIERENAIANSFARKYKEAENFQAAFNVWPNSHTEQLDECEVLDICKRHGLHTVHGPKPPASHGIHNAIKVSLGFAPAPRLQRKL